MDELIQKRIGQRIRELRLRRGMTQAQLAGNAVSRNMLSMIENGNAVPSLSTLLEFSRKLDVAVGFFFAETEQETSDYLRLSEIGEIRRLYADGCYSDCLQHCKSLPVPDDETVLMSAECLIEEVWKACANYTLKTALTYLDEIRALEQKSVHIGEPLRQTVEYLTLLIHAAPAETIPEELCSPDAFPEARITAERVLYLKALLATEKGDFGTARSMLSLGLIVTPSFSVHLESLITESDGNTAEAYDLCKQALDAAPDFFTRYRLLSSLMCSAKALNDYKAAYEYSQERIKMLEAFGR